MVMHYPSPAEVRRGGWLTRAEGRVKTKGVPAGPRPASLKRILEGADGESSLFCEGDGPVDAPDVRREVGSGRRNDARDVIAVKRALHDAGLYTMPCPAAPSPIFDSRMRVAIRTFQGRHGLKEDGVIRPGDLLLRAPDGAVNPRCRQLAVDIGNGALDLQDLSDEVNTLNDQEIELSGRIEALWAKIEGDLLRSTVSFLVRFLRVRSLIDKLRDAVSGGASDAVGIVGDVLRAFRLEDEQKRVIREKERFLGQLAVQRRKLRRLLNQSQALGCDTPNVALIV